MALQPTRRVVTGHDVNGVTTFLSDTSLSPASPLANDGSAPPPSVPGFINIAKTHGFPDTSVAQGDVFTDYYGKQMPLTDDTGVTCRIVDFPPLPEDAPDEINFVS
jgi:hypothetical protein